MRLIDADAYVKYCDEKWIPLNVDAVNAQPIIEPERTQFDCNMAYMQGKTDGIRECTEQLRKLKIKMEVEHDD